jgi:mannose-6-phosphate isomerase-like protein (cupin superfamily)
MLLLQFLKKNTLTICTLLTTDRNTMTTQPILVMEPPVYAAFQGDIDLTIPFGIKIRFLQTERSMECGQIVVLPKTDGPPLHVHNRQREKFTVHNGTLSVNLNGKWQELSAGESLVVPTGVPHTYKNASGDVCVFEYNLTPGSRFGEMMRTFERLSKAGKITSLKNFRSVLYLALVFAEFREDVLSTQPPAFVMFALARLARIMGLSL